MLTQEELRPYQGPIVEVIPAPEGSTEMVGANVGVIVMAEVLPRHTQPLSGTPGEVHGK